MATRITQLAKLISENAELIESHLASSGAPAPSFDFDAPKKLATTGQAEKARNIAISAAEEFADLLKGPATLLRWDWAEHSSFRIITQLDLARTVPVGGETTYTSVAEKSGLPERDVKRIFRHAMTRHIFVETRKGYVAHTALSRLLAEDEQQRAIAATVADIVWPACLRTADAVKKFPGSEEANETGFSLAHTPGKNMWETLSQNPEMGKNFGIFIGAEGASEHLLNAVEWKGKVVDIGGSHGSVMIDVLNKYPEVTEAVIEDLPETVRAGKERAPKDLAGRLRFEACDFFKPQPESADIFFLRWIFHNWSNKYSKNIIRNLIPVMKPGTKIVVNDILLPEPNTLPPPLEKAVRSIDMTMLALLNATERDEEGWHELFREADPRFKITKIEVTPPGLMAIITVEWKP